MERAKGFVGLLFAFRFRYGCAGCEESGGGGDVAMLILRLL
jgi:hypothetical protein